MRTLRSAVDNGEKSTICRSVMFHYFISFHLVVDSTCIKERSRNMMCKNVCCELCFCLMASSRAFSTWFGSWCLDPPIPPPCITYVCMYVYSIYTHSLFYKHEWLALSLILVRHFSGEKNISSRPKVTPFPLPHLPIHKGKNLASHEVFTRCKESMVA